MSQLTIDLSDLLADELRRIAEHEDRTVEMQARHIIRSFVSEHPAPREWALVLLSCNDKKIQTIKEIRALTFLSLKESKNLADAAEVLNDGSIIKRFQTKAEADLACDRFNMAGATARVEER